MRLSARAVGAVLTDLDNNNQYIRNVRINRITKVMSLLVRLIGGGNWNNSGYAGPSSRNGNNSALNTNANVGACGWIRNAAEMLRTAGLIPFPTRGKTHYLNALC